MTDAKSDKPAPPRVSRRVLGWFRWYTRRVLRKSFHTVAVARRGQLPRPPAGVPLIVYLNHASWWDPLVAMHLARVVTPERTLYAPFDAEALARYPIFEKLGFFPVEQQTRRGAAQFLKTAQSVLGDSDGSLWLTPEGRFVDVREKEPGFEPGLAHLATSLAASDREVWLWPLAIEYAFWEERLPEALCSFGEPFRLAEHAALDKPGWDRVLQERLRTVQADLAKRSIARDPSDWQILIGGAEGVGGVYEGIRWLSAKLTGREYRAAHGKKLTDNATHGAR